MALTTSLKSYYKLDSNSNDNTGTNNGTDTSISYVSGKISNAASFNGTTSKINLATTTSLTRDLTFNCWVNCTNTMLRQAIFVKGNGINNAGSVWSFEIGNVTSKLSFALIDGITNPTVTSSGSISNSTWTMVTITYDGTTMRLYINGTADGTQATTSSLNNITMDTAIGYFGSLAGISFSGSIDEFGIWSRALSSTEVTQLYNSGTGLTYPFGESLVNTAFLSQYINQQ